MFKIESTQKHYFKIHISCNLFHFNFKNKIHVQIYQCYVSRVYVFFCYMDCAQLIRDEVVNNVHLEVVNHKMCKILFARKNVSLNKMCSCHSICIQFFQCYQRIDTYSSFFLLICQVKVLSDATTHQLCKKVECAVNTKDMLHFSLMCL